MLSPPEIIEFFNQTKGVTNIKFEERSFPIGWGGKLGDLVSIKITNLIYPKTLVSLIPFCY